MIDKINTWYDSLQEPWRILTMLIAGTLCLILIINPYTVVLGLLLVATVLYIRFRAPHIR